MKKIQKFIKKNWITIIIFAVAIIITAASTFYAAETIFASNQVSYDNSNSTLTSTNVQGALDELYTKSIENINVNAVHFGMKSGDYVTGNCITPTLNEGDYFTMIPTNTTFAIPKSLTGYNSVQTINPSELTLWRVIKKNDCNVEAVSEYVSSTEVFFRGTTGYRNYVGALNIIASSYENSTYTVGSRMMGYDGQTEFITDTSGFDGSTDTAPSTTSTSSPYTGTGQEYSGGVLGDTLYLKDIQLVGNVYKTDTTKYGKYGLKSYKVNDTATNGNYWLAIRGFNYYSATRFVWGARFVRSGSLFGNVLRNFDSGWNDNTGNYSVRPIITLKSEIQIAGGSGTITEPYTITT